MLWHIQISPAPGSFDHEGRRVEREAAELHLPGPWSVSAARGFLVQGRIDSALVKQLAESLLADPVVETFVARPCTGARSTQSAPADGRPVEIHVLPKAGVTDPEGESALELLRDVGHCVDHCRTIRTYHVQGPAVALDTLTARVLANDAVEIAVRGPLPFDHLGEGADYRFQLVSIPLRAMSDPELIRVSRDGHLSLSLGEMHAIQAHFKEQGRDPTDCELETIAQTWSEHCSHKTLRGVVEFEGERIDNLLKSTIFQATKSLDLDWLVSVFEDNAGVVAFDDAHDVCFKVETHNHPSAIDPYGGANTGIGGVIRDPLGTGLGAKPIANTDVFCVAPPDTPPESLPPGVLHPKRVLRGVVAGVRDYGNRMGIPTVNGALAVNPGYLANPLVFCGTVGVLPKGKTQKHVEPGDLIVAVGGRTGRDGIHGATFSSVDLTSESQALSGGAVQIGNAITEKMVLDVVLQARDRGLFRSITDCGAGGFSSAVGEMGASLGAEVDLENAPLKYQGLSYTEIWISEAQERMVLAVPPEHWKEFHALAAGEHVETTVLGRFVDTGRLTLHYRGHTVGDLSMHFLHEGRPRVRRQARFSPPPQVEVELPRRESYNEDLLNVLADWNVASKEWIVRQYDHEVQGRTILKPMVGREEDGPGDAAVLLPVRDSWRGLAVACGLNHRLGMIDPYAMAAGCIDEAIRNCVAVGADPERIALLDNFCWGNPERPETLGALVLAARACHDLALAYRTPFISGKDSLYNEYVHEGRSRAIPSTLLISALGQVPDVRHCVTMDLKEPGNALYVIGTTTNALGGSIWIEQLGLTGGRAPQVEPAAGRRTFLALHHAIAAGLVGACHDVSDGGLAAALAEMCLAGRLGANVSLGWVPGADRGVPEPALLFAEDPSRFVVEVRPAVEAQFQEILTRRGVVAWGRVGVVDDATKARLVVQGRQGLPLIDVGLDRLLASWKRTLDD
jgi:phosphoribosylformylglycinamidine synthase